MVTLCIACLLAAIAAPSFSAAVRSARRADGIAALAAVQAAEDRYRATHTGYGTLADAGAASSSAAGHYAVTVVAPGTAGYRASAVAVGSQEADAACRCLQLVVTGGDALQSSGPDDRFGNDAAANRQCWRS